MTCPQLFINYKLKSLAHLPWRQMTYKFLNAIIDDPFAFVIKMPTLHWLSVFRDGEIQSTFHKPWQSYVRWSNCARLTLLLLFMLQTLYFWYKYTRGGFIRWTNHVWMNLVLVARMINRLVKLLLQKRKRRRLRDHVVNYVSRPHSFGWKIYTGNRKRLIILWIW